MLISYFLTLLVIWNISNVQMVKLKSEKHQGDEIKKLIDCKICQEMFQYEFNYEKLLKDDSKINFIKSFFGEISETDFNLREYFSKDNLDFVSKEISMQYFFKGEDSLFSSEENLEKFKNCKSFKTAEATENRNLNNQCEVMKLKICENVLSFEADVCVNFHKKISLLKNKTEKSGKLIKDNSSFSAEDASNNFLKSQKTSELEIKLNQTEKDKDKDSGNAVIIRNLKEKQKVKSIISLNKDKNINGVGSSSNASSDNNSISSFIANKENIVDDYESLKKKFSNFNKNLNLNKKEDFNINNYNKDNINEKTYNAIKESVEKLIEMKPKNEQQDERLNFRSKQNNKFISVDFNGSKQDAITEENDAFAEKDFNKLLMRNNLRKSKKYFKIDDNRIDNNAKSQEDFYKEMLFKVLSKDSNANKGFLGKDFISAKGLNAASESSKQRFFGASENSGNNFLKNKGN